MPEELIWPALILLGVVVGAYGTMIGAGGGFVLVPLLIILYPDLSPEAVTSISLAVVLLNALSGSVAYARQRRIDYKAGAIFATATVPGAAVGRLRNGPDRPTGLRDRLRACAAGRRSVADRPEGTAGRCDAAAGTLPEAHAHGQPGRHVRLLLRPVAGRRCRTGDRPRRQPIRRRRRHLLRAAHGAGHALSGLHCDLYVDLHPDVHGGHRRPGAPRPGRLRGRVVGTRRAWREHARGRAGGRYVVIEAGASSRSDCASVQPGAAWRWRCGFCWARYCSERAMRRMVFCCSGGPTACSS